MTDRNDGLLDAAAIGAMLGVSCRRDVLPLFVQHLKGTLRVTDDGEVIVTDGKGAHRQGVTVNDAAAELRAKYDGAHPARYFLPD
jgi:hypothetical protein